MRVSHHPDYAIPLPDGHPFPMRKFTVLRELLLAERLLRAEDIVEPHEASWSTIGLAHTERYLDALRNGTLDRLEERRLGLPWSEALVRRSRLAVTGTLNAAWFAMEDGIGANLAGGTHHALPDGGEGFCVLNDVAIAIRCLKRERIVRRAIVVDLDVHHGNANAVAFADDPDVFTMSMHGARNFPLRKPASDLDVPLADHTGDVAYLDRLARALPDAIERARPDLVVYLAGVDVVIGDRYGRLAMTRDGLRRRDRYVIELTKRLGLPLCMLLSGGYARTPELTADLHAESHRQAAAVHAPRPVA